MQKKKYLDEVEKLNRVVYLSIPNDEKISDSIFAQIKEEMSPFF